MTNDTRAAAEQLHKQLGLRSAMCHCAEIDFTDWPTDLRAACDYCRTVDVIERAIQQARAPLRWTRETPTKPGYYWFRNTTERYRESRSTPEIMQLRLYAGRLALGNSTVKGFTLLETGEWIGPLEVPE